jgi:hypothetical protein
MGEDEKGTRFRLRAFLLNSSPHQAEATICKSSGREDSKERAAIDWVGAGA